MVHAGKIRLASTILLTTLGFTSLLQSQSTTPDSLSWEDVVRMVVRNSPSVAQATANIAASDARVKQTQTVDLPTVGFDGSYVRIGPVPELFFPGLGVFKLYPENNYDAHVGVRQTVYDFGKSSSNVDVVQSRIKTAEETAEYTKSFLAYQSIQLFYSILFLKQSIQVENQEIETLNQHLLVNRKRLQAGSGTDFEVLTTQVRVAAAQNQRIDLENMLAKQQIALRRLLGVADSLALNLRGEFALIPVNVDPDSLKSTALRQRPEILSARAEEMTSTLQFRAARLSEMPIVSVNASYGVKNGFIPNLDILRGNWVAGVELRVPLYEGGLTDYKEQEAQATMDGSSAHVMDVERQISSEVNQSVSDLQAAQNKLETAVLQVQQASEALSIAQKSYDAGAVSNLDVLDAETALSQANLFRLRSLYEFVTSRYGLERAIGTAIWK